MRTRRSWFALVYVLATVLAQGVHDHGAGSDSSAIRHEAGCDDPRLHLSGHWSPDLSQARDHCLACQYRAEHHSWLAAAPSCLRPSTVGLAEVSLPPTHSGSSHRIRCRAPPRV